MTVQTSSSQSFEGRCRDLRRLFRDNQITLLSNLGIGPKHAQELMDAGMVCTAVSAVRWFREIETAGTETAEGCYEIFKDLSSRSSAHLEIWNRLRELEFPVDSPNAVWLVASPNHALAFVKQLNALLHFDYREERF